MRKLALVVLLLLVTAASVRSGDGEVRLLTDETIPLYLARGRELARNQQWTTMIDVLQRIVIGDPKVFTDLKPDVLNAAVYSDDGQIFYPARELCLKELAAMPPEGLRAYRSVHDAAAKTLFSLAEDEADLETRITRYARVYDDYLISSVGDDALDRAGSLNLELGRYYEALAQFRRLVDLYPRDTDRDLPMILAKAAYCAARIGDKEHRDVLLERLASEYPNKRIQLEGKSVATANLGSHPALRIRGATRSSQGEDWAMPGGNPARSRVAEDLPEDLPRKPLWRFKLSERDPRLEASFGRWRVLSHNREDAVKPLGNVHHEYATPYPTVRPTVYDGLVLYKDGLEFIGRRIGSGQFVAMRAAYQQRYERVEGLSDPNYRFPVRDVRKGPPGTKPILQVSEDIHRFFDYGGHSVVVAGDHIFTVENFKPLTYLRADAALPRPPRGNLLVAYNRFGGKTMWAWQGDLCARSVRANPAAFEEWSKDYQLHQKPFFRGPGVASGTMLYTIAYEAEGMDGVSLWAFDLKQGRVRFRTLIHHPDEVRQRLPVGASLAVAGGVVYVLTNSGVLAAVDALPPGRVRWISRYKRKYEQTKVANKRWRRGRRTASQINVNFAYNDPVVSAGKVIVAAPDATDLIAFDAETGRVAWRQSRDVLGRKVSHILGVSQGVLVMGGSQICGIDVATGKLLWGPNTLLRAFAYGRGFVSEKYAYVPTMRPKENRAAVYRYDIKTGAEASPLRFDVRKLGNLVSIDGRLIAANDEEIMCFSTKQRELDTLDRRMKRLGETGAALVERAHIHLVGNRRDDAARKDFARARAAAKRRGERMRTSRIRSLDHLFRIAQVGRDLTALEEAHRITGRAREETRKARVADSARRAARKALAEARKAEEDATTREAREAARQAQNDARKALQAAHVAGKGHDLLARLLPYEAQTVMLEAMILGRLGRAQDAFDALEKFLDDYAGVEVRLNNTVVGGATAAKKIRGDLMRTNEAFRKAFVDSVRRRIRAAFEKGDAKALENIPLRYDNAPPTEESFFALARLHDKNGDTVDAEKILRELIERFKSQSVAAEAHLRLARILIGKGLIVEARTERNKGISRIDEKDRGRLAALLAEIDKQLPAPGQPSVVPRLAFPLTHKPMRMNSATPVQIQGDVSRIRGGKPLLVLADTKAYYGVDPDGTLLWTQRNPAGAGISLGDEQDPETNIVAAAVAAARFAMAVGNDIIIGDVFGLVRIDSTNGNLRWWRPTVAADAARDARAALAGLHSDITVLKKEDNLPRRNRLPRYAVAGGVVISVDPTRGVEAFGINSGELIWQNPEIRSPAIGAPQALGQLLAVGWANPGRVRVFGLTDASIHYNYTAAVDPRTKRPRVLLAPPVLDPVGRLLVVTGNGGVVQPEGRLEIINARTGRPAFPRRFPAHGRYARVLHADGNLVVFHDGGSGGMNLHFIDLRTQRVKSTKAADLLREVHVINDGARLFVFTYTLGLSDLGARLFRIDLEGRDSLDYDRPPGARAYARPMLTRNHIVVAASGAASARLRLYDREASRETRHAKKIFHMGGNTLMPEFEVRPAGEVRYSVAPAVAVADKSLFFSTAFRNLRFVGPKPR